ncbi:MAG: hypothetical protein NC411_08190 [Bacteroides sp.]|nr:hypothetical protein [Bacteroides sp.]
MSFYKIGDLVIDSGKGRIAAAIASMTEFSPFAVSSTEECPLLLELSFTGDYEDTAVFASAALLYHTVADDAEIFFYRDADRSFILRTVCNGESLSMRCHPDRQLVSMAGTLSRRLLKYTLWIAYGIRALRHGRVPIHSSVIECDGMAYLFLGESGTGKSTHTRLWTENIAEAKLLNDDSPVVGCTDSGIMVYGSPWSGKTPCYRADKFPAAAFTRLSQAKVNEIKRLGVAGAYAALHPSLPPAFSYDGGLGDAVARIEGELISRVPVCAMRCLPDADAAIISHSFLTDLSLSHSLR